MSNLDFDPKKATHYEDLARKAVFGYDQLFTMVLSLLAEDQNETANVMVVGCGTGMELTTFRFYNSFMFSGWVAKKR